MEKRLVKVAEAVLGIDRQLMTCLNEKVWPLPGLMKLDENENAVGPSPKVAGAINDYLRNQPLNWHDNRGVDDELRDKLSEHLSLPREAFSCLGGSLMATEYVARTYLEPGVEVLFDSPCDSNVVTIAQSTGAHVIQVAHINPLNPQIETIINHINPRTRAIFLGNPNELSGAAYTESEIVFLLAYAERIMVVVREEFVEFCGCSISDLAMRFSNLIVIRSFGGAFGLAAIPASYLISDPENIDLVERLKNADDISGLACAAACAALGDLAHIKNCVESITQSKKILLSSLPQIGYEFRLGPANFILLKVLNTYEAFRRFSLENILVCDLSNYNGLKDYVRITVGTPEQMEKLLIVLSRMAPILATGFNRNRQEPVFNRPALKLQEMAKAR